MPSASIFAIDLDAPVYVQYLDYLSKLTRGDLGMSLLARGTPVAEIIIKNNLKVILLSIKCLKWMFYRLSKCNLIILFI